MTGCREGIGKRPHHQRTHAPGVPKPNLRLGGMNVHVDV